MLVGVKRLSNVKNLFKLYNNNNNQQQQSISNNSNRKYFYCSTSSTSSTAGNNSNTSIDDSELVHRTLTIEEIEQFKSQGYLVKKGLFGDQDNDRLLTQHQVELRDYLVKNAEIDLSNCSIGSRTEAIQLDNQHEKIAHVSNGFGGMINFYHGTAMYRLRESPLLYDSFSQLYQHTYAIGDGRIPNDNLNVEPQDSDPWPCKYGSFNPYHMYMFVNRCSFRIPTIGHETIQKPLDQLIQRGTGTHMDCNPYHLFSGEIRNGETGQMQPSPLRFWQPIQAFISLTDTINPDEGGFWCLPSFHTKCVSHFNSTKLQQPSWIDKPLLKRGNAFDMDESEYGSMIGQMKFIPIKRGDILFFDWRTPHHNDARHVGNSIREVVYSAHLPKVSVNETYAAKQLNWYLSGAHPSYVSKAFSKLEMDNYSPPPLTPLGEKLISLQPWS
ncbi:hypothetical protein DFA_06102 [Cavenderia fasciculata]|uniref:Phytanoyl-CoA dioxygenase n=1 Tax=Cavenderia fasciculata TaxID=261658 RepID=F4PK40_CACFS|nr:uncharacterized protein DFA_06102 [Cavenderia fasciculata]EGG23964.1 hypothetical protein DFA_06102 [Cavenderia fasciculata]|eukprot:XP_004361815.1 hypothetical protein DFA_06102 [Cavenderia fasciculata]